MSPIGAMPRADDILDLPFGTRILPVEATRIQGTSDPLVDVLAEEMGMDVLAAVECAC